MTQLPVQPAVSQCLRAIMLCVSSQNSPSQLYVCCGGTTANSIQYTVYRALSVSTLMCTNVSRFAPHSAKHQQVSDAGTDILQCCIACHTEITASIGCLCRLVLCRHQSCTQRAKHAGMCCWSLTIGLLVRAKEPEPQPAHLHISSHTLLRSCARQAYFECLVSDHHISKRAVRGCESSCKSVLMLRAGYCNGRADSSETAGSALASAEYQVSLSPSSQVQMFIISHVSGVICRHTC